MVDLYTIILAIVFFILFLIVFSKNSRSKKFFIKVVILSLVVLAFCFNPIKAYEVNGDYTDLYRFFYDMNSFSIYGWDCPDIYLKTDYSAIFISKLLVFFISKIGVFNLLSAISALLVYGITYWIFLDFIKTEKLDIKYAAIGFFIFLVLYNYSIIITNIRMPIAMVLFFLIIYFDFIKKKDFKICLIFYLLLLFIHTAFILFLMVRLIALITTNKNYRFISLLFLCYGFFIDWIGMFLSNNQTGVYFKELWDKFYLYFYTVKANDFNFWIAFLRSIKNYSNIIFIK